MTTTREHIKTVFSFLLIGIIITIGFYFQSSNFIVKKNISFVDKQILPVHIGNKTVMLSVAAKDDTRKQGLSNSQPLVENTGMLFVFNYSSKYGFWMKEMNYPIDIFWIDSKYKIVHIEQNLSPDTYPMTFGSEYMSQYVIELPAGFATTNNVNVGDSISIGE